MMRFLRCSKTYTEENGCKVNCCDVAAACRCFRSKTVTPAGATEIMEIIGKDEIHCQYPRCD